MGSRLVVELPVFVWAGTGTSHVGLMWSGSQEDTTLQPLADLSSDTSQVMWLPDRFCFILKWGSESFACLHVVPTTVSGLLHSGSQSQAWGIDMSKGVTELGCARGQGDY